jgi:hypothetical protein
MLKKYTPPYITILVIINIINIISSTYFIAFFLAGVTFKIFTISIKNEHNYMFLFSIITFLIIENTQGLKLFSLTITALVVYFFIIPRIKHLFSSSVMLDFLYIFAFYILFYILFQSYIQFDLSVMITFIINFFIDIIIIGFIL